MQLASARLPAAGSLGKVGEESDDNLVVHALEEELAVWTEVRRSARNIVYHI